MKSEELWNDEISFPFHDRWELISDNHDKERWQVWEERVQVWEDVMQRPLLNTARYYKVFKDYFIAAQEVLNELD